MTRLSEQIAEDFVLMVAPWLGERAADRASAERRQAQARTLEPAAPRPEEA